MTQPVSGTEFVVGFGRDIVAELAPAELSVFEAVSAAFLRDPKRVLSRRSGPGVVLGSGIDVVVLTVSPVALAVATAVYQQLVDKTAESTVKHAVRMVNRLRRGKQPEPLPEITAEVRDTAAEGTRTLVENLTEDPDLARQCADVVRVLLDRRR
ncbi:hypothetical protein [Paractinoplanes toevensis]|uniref:Uncharacterized protein n=1 Tax=Paractinoplanes toevensis TaxID=571911 RepID=A0A919W7Q6_9ACTN|nr:hypothetical protein [Actinoplanes toevensis]GIM89856.1 hypothetical protein Ato02nite_016490 [Actinoplanes toevensis]